MLSVRQRLQLYAAIVQEQRARQSLRDRIQMLRARPQELTEDDLDRWQDIDRRLLRGLFTERPWIREQFEEYMDTPKLQVPSLFQFSRRAFPHAGFGNKPFKYNWHHIIMCLAYQDFYAGKISRLMINVPPSTNKSTTSGVMFQAWAWAQDPMASFMYTSYSNEMPIKFTGHLKTLVKSPWYQRRWGKNFAFIKESQRELRNNRGGWHFATSIHGAGQGIHPRFIFIDDPQKGMHTSSETKMAEAPKYFSNTLASRGLMEEARIAIVMQRLAINDLCGVILGETGGEDADEIDDPELDAANADMKAALATLQSSWHHICLPMRFDPDHPYRYPLDPRTEKGELLWPEELPLLAVLRLIREMGMAGEPNVESQLDQNPKLTNKKLFGDVTIGRINATELPLLLRQGKCIRAWDRASTRGAGDYTVGCLMCLCGGTYYILDVYRRQLGATERDNEIVRVAKADKARFEHYRVASEKSIGADADNAHTDLAKRLDAIGVECVGVKTGGKSKYDRAIPLATAYENMLVRHLEGKSWTNRFETEFSNFPDGAHDDQVDAAVHAHKELRDWQEHSP